MIFVHSKFKATQNKKNIDTHNRDKHQLSSLLNISKISQTSTKKDNAQGKHIIPAIEADASPTVGTPSCTSPKTRILKPDALSLTKNISFTSR
jgi:hypothetical protein